MSIEIKMPSLSPTMEEATLAKWLVREGDTVKAGDIMAEIETDKATIEFEAVDEGTIGKIVVTEGTDNVKVGAVIVVLLAEGEGAPGRAEDASTASPKVGEAKAGVFGPTSVALSSDRVKASPLALRLAAKRGIDLAKLSGSGPGSRIVKADLDAAKASASPPAAAPVSAKLPAVPDIPHELSKLSNMRKTIAPHLAGSKKLTPHIYLTVDIRLDELLKLRTELNDSLAACGVKLSINDMLIKALGASLMAVPKCNVMFTPDQLVTFDRADISVAVSTPTGIIAPIIKGAGSITLSSISTQMKDFAARARDNKLKREELEGGTASISNMGMFGIKQFEAVINPPQGMILAVGASETRPHVVDGALGVATLMTATGSFDHRVIDGADGANLMKIFQDFCERPLLIIA